MEFEYLADRPEEVPRVIAWWRSEWRSRMGADIECLESQLRESLSKSELPIHVLATIDGTPVGIAALKISGSNRIISRPSLLVRQCLC